MPLPTGLQSKTLTFGRYSSVTGANKGGNVRVGFEKAMLHIPTGEIIVAGDESAIVDPETGVLTISVPVTVTDDLVADWMTASPFKNQRLKITVSVPGYPPEARYVDIHPSDPMVMDYDMLNPYSVPGGLTVLRAEVRTVAGLSGDITIEQLRQALGATYTTATRPAASSVGVGTMIFDATLGIPLWSNGAGWRDATGASR